MEIIVKKGTHRIDRKHPESTDPEYEVSRRAGQFMLNTGQVKFDSPEEEAHYWKQVNSNPNNVPGLPAFFPALETRVFSTSPAERPVISEIPCGHDWVNVRIDRHHGRCVYTCRFGHQSFQSLKENK